MCHLIYVNPAFQAMYKIMYNNSRLTWERLEHDENLLSKQNRVFHECAVHGVIISSRIHRHNSCEAYVFFLIHVYEAGSIGIANFLLILCFYSVLYITQVLPVVFPLKWFYSEIDSDNKNFELSYSTYVVFILSYLRNVLVVSSNGKGWVMTKQRALW